MITEREQLELTLRDYFAAKALQGMLADSTFNGPPEDVAELAYKMADAMLAERAKKHD